jgi:hypothetical protein
LLNAAALRISRRFAEPAVQDDQLIFHGTLVKMNTHAKSRAYVDDKRFRLEGFPVAG